MEQESTRKKMTLISSVLFFLAICGMLYLIYELRTDGAKCVLDTCKYIDERYNGYNPCGAKPLVNYENLYENLSYGGIEYGER